MARDSPKVEESAGSSRKGQTRASSATATDTISTPQASNAILTRALLIDLQRDTIGRDFEKVQRLFGPRTRIKVAAALILYIHRRVCMAANYGSETPLASGAQSIISYVLAEHLVEQAPTLSICGHMYILETNQYTESVEAAEEPFKNSVF